MSANVHAVTGGWGTAIRPFAVFLWTLCLPVASLDPSRAEEHSSRRRQIAIVHSFIQPTLRQREQPVITTATTASLRSRGGRVISGTVPRTQLVGRYQHQQYGRRHSAVSGSFSARRRYPR